ncbi:MAG: alpha/beta hydrolase [Candidatus Marinimicrobia bacterium]|nr:alpha/beta hydrolase [Candidatus Neomarinimicrobiota bacterium]
MNRPVIEKDYFVEGRKCHYAFLDGDSALSPIVFLHGVTTFGHYFDDVISHMNLENSIYLMDFKGHGKSDWKNDYYTIESYSDDIYSFLESLDFPVHIVGHSLGGRVGIHLTATYPDAIKSLSILDVAPSVDMAGFMRLANAISKVPIPFDDRDHVIDFYTNIWGASKRFIEMMLEYGIKPEQNDQLSARFDPNIFSLPMDIIQSEIDELWKASRSIKQPTLIVRGEHSDVLSPEIAKELQTAIPHADYVEIKNSSHSIPPEQPQALANVIQSFIVD